MTRKIDRPYAFRQKWESKEKTCLAKLLGCSPLELAYLAGLIDGEGTLALRKMQKGYYRPIVNIVNTDEELIKFLHRYFWQAIVPQKNGRGVPYLRVALNGFGIDPFLEAIEPYLVAKKIHCQLLRTYIACRKAQPWRASPSAIMLEMVSDLRMLNLRGARSPQLKQAVRQKYSLTSQPQPITTLPTAS